MLDSSAMSGPGWTFWAILVSALIAGFIALLTVAKQRIVTKKRAAYDLILTMWTDYLRDCETTFLDLVEKDDLDRVLNAKTPDEIRDKTKIQNYLNHMELMAVCIKWNIVDENVCKAIVGDKLVKRWKAAVPLVDAIRRKEGDDEFFEHFQNVAKEWSEKPTIIKKNWFITVVKEIFKI